MGMDEIMNEREFRKLGRGDLMNMISTLQLESEKLESENRKLAAELEEARKHIPTKKELDRIAAMREDNKRLHLLEAQADKLESIQTENEELRRQLEQRPEMPSDAGNIADAAVRITGLFETAQKTADTYIAEVKKANAEAETRAQGIISAAQEEAADIVSKAQEIAHLMCEDAQNEVDEKWKQFNENVNSVLKAHSELSSILGLSK